METMTTAELLEMTPLAHDSVDAQFQYWLAATFAVVIASFTAEDRIGPKTRWVVALLYLLVTLLFTFRFFSVGRLGRTLIQETISRGVPWESFSFPYGSVRFAIIILGTVLAVWFLVSGFKKIDSADSRSD